MDSYLRGLIGAREDAAARIREIIDGAEAQHRALTGREQAELRAASDAFDQAKRQAEELSAYQHRAARTSPLRAAIEPAIRAMRSDGPLETTAVRPEHPSDYLYRATLTTTASSALATRQDWSDVFAPLADQSVAIRSGVRVIHTDATTLHLAAGTALAAGAWLGAGGTATASDAGYRSTDVTPARLGVLSEFSREVFEDRELFEAQAGEQMLRTLAITLDKAIYEGTGASNQPQGMLNLAGSGTATAVAAVTDFSRFAAAKENAYKSGSDVKVWAANGDVWGQLAGLTVAIGGTADRRPLLSENVNAGGAAIAQTILGSPLYVTGGTQIIATTGGTASTVYGYDPNQVLLIVRRDYSMMVDPYSKAEQGIIRLYLEGRFGVHFPQPAAVQVVPINNLT